MILSFCELYAKNHNLMLLTWVYNDNIMFKEGYTESMKINTGFFVTYITIFVQTCTSWHQIYPERSSGVYECINTDEPNKLILVVGYCI